MIIFIESSIMHCTSTLNIRLLLHDSIIREHALMLYYIRHNSTSGLLIRYGCLYSNKMKIYMQLKDFAILIFTSIRYNELQKKEVYRVENVNETKYKTKNTAPVQRATYTYR